MPQSIYPALTKIDDAPAVRVWDEDARNSLEEILETNERLQKQLSLITGTELDKGEL